MEQVKIALIRFVDKVKALYPDLKVEIDYDSLCDHYEIWHNNPELQFEDKNFIANIGALVEELFNQKIYNFSFGYDHFKTMESKAYRHADYHKVNINMQCTDSIAVALETFSTYLKDYNFLKDANNFTVGVQVLYKKFKSENTCDIEYTKLGIPIRPFNDKELAA